MRRSMRWEAPSMPTAAYDPGLLCEQETPLEIGKDWFLDHKIPAGGFVRILDSSQVWEERVDETRIITTEGLTTCLDPGRGWTITSGEWNFLEKQECWEGHEQALPPKNREIALQTPRNSRLLDCQYSYSAKPPAKRDFTYITGLNKLVHPVKCQIGSKMYPNFFDCESEVQLVLKHSFCWEIPKDFITRSMDLIRID